MTIGKLKQLLRKPGLKAGHYIGEFFTPGIGYMLAEAGADFAFLDMEHSAVSFETINASLRFLEAAGVPAMVRVPSHAYDHVARLLDIGADGVILPMVGTVEQAQAVIRAMKYTPRGQRGVAPGIANDRYRMGPVVPALEAANERTAFIALIETRDGIENVDAIAALEDVDCLFVGHFDLSCSLGIPGEFEHPDFKSAIRAVLEAGQRHGKALGRLVSDAESGAALFDDGWDMICYSGDVWLFQTALKEGLASLRDRAGKKKNT